MKPICASGCQVSAIDRLLLPGAPIAYLESIHIRFLWAQPLPPVKKLNTPPSRETEVNTADVQGAEDEPGDETQETDGMADDEESDDDCIIEEGKLIRRLR